MLIFISINQQVLCLLIPDNWYKDMMLSLYHSCPTHISNASTWCGQAIDTCIFITIAFYGIVPELGIMILSQYLFKVGLAFIDTPLFYLFTRKS